ncbi:DUF167 domain-containing protein [Candidatus Woesearchaeota archaeon]|nr:DUF167 domain-containing protein [Candidatus Woesearchaeota archaeon]
MNQKQNSLNAKNVSTFGEITADLQKFIENNKLRIIVKPNSKKTEILGYNKNKKAIKLAVSTLPEKNKANIELIKFFSKLTKKKISIISGLTSKEKVIKFNPTH